MHAAAMKPSFLSKEEVPESLLTQTREEAKAQLEATQQVGTDDPKKLAKIIEGKQNKAISLLYKRDVLYEQELATSADSMTVGKYLKEESKRIGSDVSIKDWALFVIS
jgi:elongation factor Ts